MFYEGKLINPGTMEVFRRLMINMPPQHGKTRTLIYFCQWVFGQDQEERVITCSYNDSIALDFSRYTRDGIQERRNTPVDIVFSDIFPWVRIKRGSASVEKWALEGQHFSYLGAGMMGSITSKGGTILMIDDPVKGAMEAMNEAHLEKIWMWYIGTFLQRVSAEAGEPLEIINMTRWSKKDPCGRLLSEDDADLWYVLKLEAYDRGTNAMLCPDFLSKKRYFYLKKHMLNEIFLANYHQEPIDILGILYKSFKIYHELPCNEWGDPLIEIIHNYIDTADEGSNYLCSIVYAVIAKEGYLLDVYFTRDGMEITEQKTAEQLNKWKVKLSRIESNAGGRSFARNVKRILWDDFKNNKTIVRWFHQSLNKRARIITHSNFVVEHIYFPENWKDRWPIFHEHVTTHLKEGKNKFDDAEDALTGVAENLSVSKVEILK